MQQPKQNKKQQKQAPENFTGEGFVMPCDKDAEGAVIGECLIEPMAFSRIAYVKSEYFYVPAYEKIFACFHRLFKLSQPIDLITVISDLNDVGDLEAIGGPVFISKLTTGIVKTIHLENHAKIIIKKYLARQQIILYREKMYGLYTGDDPADIGEKVSVTLAKLMQLGANDNVKALADLAADLLNELELRSQREEELSGVTSGFVDLDRHTNGWQMSDLIILGARPSVGKSAFAINLAVNAAFSEEEIPVMFFSLEMSAKQIVERIFAIRFLMALADIRRRPTAEQIKEINDNIRKVESGPIFIDDTAAINWLEVSIKVKKQIAKWEKDYPKFRKHRKGLIVIDYLQLMNDVNDGIGKNREQMVSNISRNLKILAKQINMPVIALSQLSRGLETQKREPMLSDLRESGAIEQDADVIMFIYRPDDKEGHETGETIIKIAKQRNGALDRVKLIGKLHIQKFYTPGDQLNEFVKPANHDVANNFSTGIKFNPGQSFDAGFNEDKQFGF